MIGPSKEIRDELKRLWNEVLKAEHAWMRRGTRAGFGVATAPARAAHSAYMQEHGLTINGRWSAEGERRLLKEKMRTAFLAGWNSKVPCESHNDRFEDWYKEHGTL